MPCGNRQAVFAGERGVHGGEGGVFGNPSAGGGPGLGALSG